MKNIYIRHIILLGVLCAGLLFFLSVSLKWYTRHERSFPIPDLTGMTLREASSILETHHLRYRINDSVYQNQEAPGVILTQNPLPGTHVKNQRTVFFIVNASEPEKTTAPSVVGVTLRQARNILESKGLSVGKISYVPDIARNNVLQQMFQGRALPSGEEIIKGSAVDLVLGLGIDSQNVTEIPEVIGLNLVTARDRIHQSLMNLGTIFTDRSIQNPNDSLQSVVWKQSPEPAAKAPAGTLVDVWITTDLSLVPASSATGSPDNDLADME